MLVLLLVTLLSVFVTAIVSGGNEHSYLQSRDFLGWKVEEGNAYEPPSVLSVSHQTYSYFHVQLGNRQLFVESYRSLSPCKINSRETGMYPLVTSLGTILEQTQHVLPPLL